LVAAQLRGPRLTRIITNWITVDGLDATQRAEALLEKIPESPVLLSGVTFGGFNLIDPARIHSRFKVPTIVVVGSRPNNRSVKQALVKHFPDWRERWEIIRSLGPLRSVRTMTAEPSVFYEALGCSAKEAKVILTGNSWVSRVPEPIRVAGLVARGLFGETTRTLS
jgi:endonuclease V-like protein UPF0215 family